MRRILVHQINSLNRAIEINPSDLLTAGGAPVSYHLELRQPAGNMGGIGGLIRQISLGFQDGPVQEVGLNGFTTESFLAVLIDRLGAFQAGPFPCTENASALRHLQEALFWLQARSREREARGVDGQLKK